jgi:hypothetical protein
VSCTAKCIAVCLFPPSFFPHVQTR